MKINYVYELNQFDVWLETHPDVTSSQILLWYALMRIANKAGWPQKFSVSMSTLENKTRIKKDSILSARNRLKKNGLIGFASRPGRQAAMYWILPFDCKNKYEQEKTDDQTFDFDTEDMPTIDQGWEAIHKCYFDNFSAMIPQGVREEKLHDYYEQFGEEIVCLAIQQTAMRAGESEGRFAYLMAILNRWSNENVKSIEDAKKQIEKHRNALKHVSNAQQNESDRADYKVYR